MLRKNFQYSLFLLIWKVTRCTFSYSAFFVTVGWLNIPGVNGSSLRRSRSIPDVSKHWNDELFHQVNESPLNETSNDIQLSLKLQIIDVPSLNHRQLESSNSHDGRIRIEQESYSKNNPLSLLFGEELNREVVFQKHSSALGREVFIDAIPEIFREHDLPYILSFKTDMRRKSFPRWGKYESQVGLAGISGDKRSMEDSEAEGESTINTIIDFIQESAMAYKKFFDYHEDGDRMIGHVVRTNDHKNDVGSWLPEVLYILHGTSEFIDGDEPDKKNPSVRGVGSEVPGLYVSDVAFNTTKTFFDIMVYRKLTSTHDLFVRAYKTFQKLIANKNTESKHEKSPSLLSRWPRLYQILVVEKGSIPFIMWNGDYTGCNYHNWRSKKASVPLFTVAASIQCQYTIPIPNYQTYDDSLETAEEWIEKYTTNSMEWKDKIPQAVWRGQLTGHMPVSTNEADRGPRYHLLKTVHTTATLEQQALFDVKLIRLSGNPEFDRLIMPYNTSSNEKSNNDTSYTATKTEFLGEFGTQFRMKMDEYNNYRAILDVDGFSWSSRFGKLLCYNSVILKVEPNFVDYFYYKRQQKKFDGVDTDSNRNENPILMPWKHYIPLKHDMSDLVEKTQYALDIANEAHITEIIKNANEWCHMNMIRDSLAHDVLDIWESYVQKVLDQSSTTNANVNLKTWQQLWNENVSTVLNSSLQMKQIEHFD